MPCRSLWLASRFLPGTCMRMRFNESQMVLATTMLCFFLYVWQHVQPQLLFYTIGHDSAFPAFQTGTDFLLSFLDRPGGICEYLAALLYQSYSSNWMGAVVTALTVFFPGAVLARIIKRDSHTSVDALTYGLAFLGGVMVSRYQSPLHLFLSLNIVVFSFWAIDSIASNRHRLRSMAIACFPLATWYLTADAACLCSILLVMAALHRKEQRVLNIVVGALSLALPLLYEYVAPPPQSVLFTSPSSPAYLKTYALACIVVIGTAATMPLLKKVPVMRRVGGLVAPIPHKILIGAACISLLAAVLAFFGTEKGQRTALLFEYYERFEKWPDIIALAHQLRREEFTATTIFDVNRALYYTGGLGEHLFDYPQMQSEGLFLLKSKTIQAKWRNALLAGDLGIINLAMKSDYELLELSGNPYFLTLLAELHLVAGQGGAATRLLTHLHQDMVYGGRARAMLHALDSDATGPERVRLLKSRALEFDIASTNVPMNLLLERLLERNGANRIAFEYLLSNHLLSGNIPAFTGLVGRFSEFGYARLPRYWAQALAQSCMMVPDPDPSLAALVPAGAWKEIEDFSSAYFPFVQERRAAGYDEKTAAEMAFEKLHSVYGNTYYFYYLVNLAGAER